MADTVKCRKCGKILDKTKERFAYRHANGTTIYMHEACKNESKSTAEWEFSDPIPSEKITKKVKQQEAYKYKYNPPVDEIKVEDKDRLKIHDLLKRHQKEIYSRKKVDRDLDRMIKDGKTYIGILRACTYWIEIEGKDFLGYNGSLAIVDSIYGTAAEYYNNEKARKEMMKTVRPIKETILETREVSITKPKSDKPYRVSLFDLD